MNDTQTDTHGPLNHGHGEVSVRSRSWFRRLFAFLGPAYLVSVGYMDPGNWATDIEGGARFGYSLIWVLLMSNLMAILLQTLAARFGIVTGLDLAQGCRREYPRPIALILWIMAEIAITATDLAEALGTIIGLNLLFGLPLLWGCLLTATDTFLLVAIQRFGVRKMEAMILSMVGTIGGCFLIEVFLAQPDWGGIATGFVPTLQPGAIYIVIGMLGATVMPHNLYLHSSLVQSRAVSNTFSGKAQACKFNFIDSAVALNAAFFINAAILVMAAADFHANGIVVTEIQQAHALLKNLLGQTLAPIAFALALLAAGQSSTITGTIAGQVVMEGFLNLRIRPWLRRLITRAVALVPAVFVIAFMGDRGTYQLLILSQVVLSLQLPFATIPLIHFTSDRNKMGVFRSARWLRALAWITAAIIVVLNGKLVYDEVVMWLGGGSWWLWTITIPVVFLYAGLLAYIAAWPMWRKAVVWESAVDSASRRVGAEIKPMPVHAIAVAVEHTDGDAEILSAAISMARSHDAHVTLIHIVETPGTMIYGHESDSLHGTEDQTYLEELARELDEHQIEVHTILGHGPRVEGIVKAVRDAKFDMLVMGSHGHRAVADLFYGATVDSVRHALDIPILVVRTMQQRMERPVRSGE